VLAGEDVRGYVTEHLGDPRKASTKSQLRLRLPTWPEPSFRVIYLGHGGLDVDKIYVDYPEVGGSAGLSVAGLREASSPLSLPPESWV